MSPTPALLKALTRAVLESGQTDDDTQRGSAVSFAGMLSAAERNAVESYVTKGPILNFYVQARSGVLSSAGLEPMLKINGLTEEEAQTTVSRLDRLMASFPPFAADVPLFRGEQRRLDVIPKPGDEVTFARFASTSPNEDIAKLYAGRQQNEDKPVVWSFNLPSGRKGLPMNLLVEARFSNQPEVLLPRDTRLRARTVEEVDGIVRIGADLL